MEINLAPFIQISAHMSLSMTPRDLILAVILGHSPLSISQELADATTNASIISQGLLVMFLQRAGLGRQGCQLGARRGVLT